MTRAVHNEPDNRHVMPKCSTAWPIAAAQKWPLGITIQNSNRLRHSLPVLHKMRTAVLESLRGKQSGIGYLQQHSTLMSERALSDGSA